MTHEIFNCFPLCQYIYLFLNKYIALEVRFICVGHLIVLLLVYTIVLSMRLTSLSKILEGILYMSICTSKVLVCSYILLRCVWTIRWQVRVALGHSQPTPICTMWTIGEAGLWALRDFGDYAGTEYQNIKELLGSTMSCIGMTTSFYTDLLLQEWFLLKSDTISSWTDMY